MVRVWREEWLRCGGRSGSTVLLHIYYMSLGQVQEVCENESLMRVLSLYLFPFAGSLWKLWQ